MVVISKSLFDSKTQSDLTCENIFHTWTKSCLKAELRVILRNYGPGVFSFYVPVYMVKLLLEYKKIDKNYFEKFLKSYLRSECFGVSYGVLTTLSMCLIKKLLGRFNYYGVGLLPGFIAGLGLLFEDDTNRHLNSLLWSSLAIEALFNNSYYFQIINYSPLRETVIFMLVSSYMMRLMVEKNKKRSLYLWFYVPSSEKDAYNITHLKKYFAENLTYFTLGYGLNIAKPIILLLMDISKFSTERLVMAILNKESLKLGLLFYTYALLFKSSMSFLQLYNQHKIANNAGIAGLIAGLSYYMKPTRNVLGLAIATVIQMLAKEHLPFQELANIPNSVLVYMACNGILFHNRVMAADTCPKYYTNMTNIGSRGLIEGVHKALMDKYLD